MAAAIAAVALMVALRQPVPFVLMTFAGSAYVLLRHRANIARLIAGTEPQLGRSRG
jgi:glycerol-3-phosphate acyltransferase PlsY